MFSLLNIKVKHVFRGKLGICAVFSSRSTTAVAVLAWMGPWGTLPLGLVSGWNLTLYYSTKSILKGPKAKKHFFKTKVSFIFTCLREYLLRVKLFSSRVIKMINLEQMLAPVLKKKQENTNISSLKKSPSPLQPSGHASLGRNPNKNILPVGVWL